jgi:hypothetical protein
VVDTVLVCTQLLAMKTKLADQVVLAAAAE